MRKLSLLLSVVAVTFQTGCSIKFDPKSLSFKKPEIEISLKEEKAPPAPPVFNCTASLDASFVKANTEVLIRITGHDGEPEYKIEGTDVTFAATTSIMRTYNSTGFQKEKLTLLDKLGKKAVCEFAIQVIDGDPTDLKCAITATPAVPHVNEAVAFKMVATGGTAPYTFQTFAAGDSIVAANLTSTSATEASAAGKYATAGARTVSVQLKDSTDTVVNCNKALSVRPALSVILSASHASQGADQPITLTATTEGFLATETTTYEWSTTESGITITPNGNTAQVKSNANINHTNFVVTVKAKSSNTEQATGNINLNFVANQPLSCTMSHSSGVFTANDEVTFTVAGSESVEIISFNAGSGATVTGSTSTTRKVKFSSSGSKTVSAVTKSTTRNVNCSVQDTIQINSALACSVYTYDYYSGYPSNSYVGDYVYLNTVVPSNSGSGGAYLFDVQTQTSYQVADSLSKSGLSAYFRFIDDGTWVVQAVVKDQAGHVAYCTTTHIAHPWW